MVALRMGDYIICGADGRIFGASRLVVEGGQDPLTGMRSVAEYAFSRGDMPPRPADPGHAHDWKKMVAGGEAVCGCGERRRIASL